MIPGGPTGGRRLGGPIASPSHISRQRWLLPAALATIYVVWGSTYLAIRVMVETMPPLLAAGARFALAGAIFWVVLVAAGGVRRVCVTRGQLAAAGLVGVLLPFGG